LLVGELRLLPRQDIGGLRGVDNLAGVRSEDGQQADLFLLASQPIPRDPNTVRRAQIGRAVVLGEFLGGEYVPAVRRVAGCVHWLFGVVIRINDKLPFDGNGLIAFVVEVEPPSEPSCGRFTRFRVDGVRPDGNHPLRLLILAFLDRLFGPRQDSLYGRLNGLASS
jgi:hypothetical protein